MINMGLLDMLDPRKAPGIAAPVARPPLKLPPGVQGIVPQKAPAMPNMTKGVKLPWQERLKEKLMPHNPALAGILSEDDVDAQRKNAMIQAGLAMMAQSGPTTGVSPNLGQILATGMQTGMGAYQQGSEKQAAMNMQKQQQEQALQQKQRLDQARSTMSVDPSLPPEQRYARLQELMMQAAQIGDVETMRSLAMVLQTTMPKGREAQKVDLGDRVLLIDENGQERIEPKGLEPGEGAGGLTPYQQEMMANRMWQREDSVDKQYQNSVEGEQGLRRKLDTALGRAGAAKAGDGAAQVEMLYAFISALDPNSAVREGEIGLAREAATLRARAAGLVRKYEGSESIVVGPELISQMERFMKKRKAMAGGFINQKRDHYISRARRGGIADPEGLLGEQVVDFGDVESNSQQGAPTAQTRKTAATKLTKYGGK